MSATTETAPPDGGNILIVGGYGQVGRSIAERLAPLFPGRVTIAGRNLDKARAAAAAIGHGAEGRAVDIFAADARDALDGVALALVCLDQTDTRFVEQCLSRGIHYVDISADYDFLSRVEKLDQLAKQKGVTAMLSVGVAPGLTNMLAACAREKMETVDRIDILLEFGLGDHHGAVAVEWLFDNLDAAYEVQERGRRKSVRSFGESINIRLPRQRAERSAYRFNFPDQHVIGRTLDIPTVSTWIRFDDRVSTWLFAKSAQAGLGRLLRRRWWRRMAVWLFMNVHMGSDICGVAARATGRSKDGAETLTLGLVGRNEALMTAIVAAETVRQLLSGSPAAGVLHSEQAITLGPVVSALRKDLPDLVVAL
jgi:short subunit dehydrogenase-like uncharacterized protein